MKQVVYIATIDGNAPEFDKEDLDVLARATQTELYNYLAFDLGTAKTVVEVTVSADGKVGQTNVVKRVEHEPITR